jgi:hypothetical protein
MTPVGEEIVALTASDGRIYPSVVVDWAEIHPESALHRQFPWDDAVAAREHRLWKARQLISLHVVDLAGDRTTISLQIDRPMGGGYRDMGEVLSTAELRRMAVEQAVGELHRWVARHRHLGELQTIFRAVDRVARQIEPPEQDAA